MDEHVFKVLEFDKVCGFLETFAQSPGGRRLCRTTQPSTCRADVRRLQLETTEMLAEIEDAGPLALCGVHDLTGEVQRTRIQDFYLDQQQLLQLAEMLETTATIKFYFSGLQEKAPTLYQLTSALSPIQSLLSRIRECISSRGDILDSASEQLADLRSHMRFLRDGIIRNLEKYLHDVDLNFAVQDDFITMRNNRFVIPVRSDRSAAIRGVVHDQSQTKATFFIEPLEILEMNNDLQLTQRAVSHEEIRILKELSATVQQQEPEILNNIALLEVVDTIHARACLSRALAARPVVCNEERALVLTNCRHPILSARYVPADSDTEAAPDSRTPTGTWVFDRPGVVDIEIIKKRAVSTLVITGANAGGKTVALKTLGLFVLMHQSGMHLPVGAEGSIAHYDKLFADIGDEQNIESCLSTFSAHMTRVKNVVTAATSQSLVLLDELGAGTDPVEGGALAAAILDHLRALGCTTLVTSHLNQLKTYAHTRDDCENVSVAFDPDTHRPLYGLVYGLPGFSNALSMAKNLGMPLSILDAANHHAGRSDRHVAELVHALEQAHHGMLEKQARLNELNEQTMLILDTGKRLLKTMQDRRDRFLKNFEESSRTLLRSAENSLRSIIKQQRRLLRQGGSSKTGTQAITQLQQIKQELFHQFSPITKAAENLDHVESGQTVRITGLKKTGRVISVDAENRRAEIDIGTMRVKTGFNELSPAGSSCKKPAKETRHNGALHVKNPPLCEKQVNVIGLRVGEALPLIDKHIDTAVLQGADTLEIIHGRGTGRLMRAIHEHLKDHIQVARFMCDSETPGRSGITHVVIK